MTTGLDQQDLEGKFSSIELFLATFPEDPTIREASIELIAATLKAIEDVIGFFLESNGESKPSEISHSGILFIFNLLRYTVKLFSKKSFFCDLSRERLSKESSRKY